VELYFLVRDNFDKLFFFLLERLDKCENLGKILRNFSEKSNVRRIVNSRLNIFAKALARKGLRTTDIQYSDISEGK
jgi:hypothetical protein